MTYRVLTACGYGEYIMSDFESLEAARDDFAVQREGVAAGWYVSVELLKIELIDRAE